MQSLVVLSVILLDRLGELVIVGQRLNRLITALKCTGLICPVRMEKTPEKSPVQTKT